MTLTPRSPAKYGWAGVGITFIPNAGYADIQLDCASIRAPLPRGLPTSGKFSLTGFRQVFRPGPQSADAVTEGLERVPTLIFGEVTGSRLVLEIRTPHGPKKVFVLNRGGGPGPVRCL